MRYIKIEGDTQFCGTHFEEYLKTNMTDKELNEYCAELAHSNAESYDYMVYGWGEDAESYAESCGITLEEAEEEMEFYYENATAYWKEVSKEEYEEA